MSLAGGALIVKAFYNDKDPALRGSISDQLRLHGISVAPVYLISRASHIGDNPFAPEDCSWNLWDKVTSGSAIFGFIPRNPAPPAYYPLYPYGNPATLPYDLKNPVNWNEFQGVVVVP